MVPAIWVGRAVVHLIHVARIAQRRRRARAQSLAARGVILLREWLSPQQRDQLDYYNFFEVIGCDSGKSYRIQCGMSTNVIDGRPRTAGASFRRAIS